MSVVLAVSFGMGACMSAAAGEARVAVASNFTATMRALVQGFERSSGHRATVSYGSSGKLYAQILNGAPFDLFLSADSERPALLEQNDVAVAGSRFTYAIGRLALWSSEEKLVDEAGKILRSDLYRRLAVANPKTAPYGVAAMEVLEALGLQAAVKERLVYGENIAQTYQFVASGNAELGFVALAQLPQGTAGSRWVVPTHLHAPLSQQAVLLVRGKNNTAALEFFEYLHTSEARNLIKDSGYDVE